MFIPAYIPSEGGRQSTLARVDLEEAESGIRNLVQQGGHWACAVIHLPVAAESEIVVFDSRGSDRDVAQVGHEVNLWLTRFASQPQLPNSRLCGATHGVACGCFVALYLDLWLCGATAEDIAADKRVCSSAFVEGSYIPYIRRTVDVVLPP